eukprot:COSAG05_NODE_517_length_9060_cov_7.019306_12_plen_178_part_00
MTPTGIAVGQQQLREVEERKLFGNCWFKKQRHDRSACATLNRSVAPYFDRSAATILLLWLGASATLTKFWFGMSLTQYYDQWQMRGEHRAASCYKAGIALLSELAVQLKDEDKETETEKLKEEGEEVAGAGAGEGEGQRSRMLVAMQELSSALGNNLSKAEELQGNRCVVAYICSTM